VGSEVNMNIRKATDKALESLRIDYRNYHILPDFRQAYGDASNPFYIFLKCEGSLYVIRGKQGLGDFHIIGYYLSKKKAYKVFDQLIIDLKLEEKGEFSKEAK
jgi:hypothetical protein